MRRRSGIGGWQLMTVLLALLSCAAHTSVQSPTLVNLRKAPPAVLTLRGGKAPPPAKSLAPGFAAAVPVASAMAAHGAFLAGCGSYLGGNQGTVLGLALPIVACAGLSVSGNFPAYMAGVHIALLMQAGAVATFGVKACRAALQQNSNTALVYCAMSAGSLAALYAEKKLKPPKNKK